MKTETKGTILAFVYVALFMGFGFCSSYTIPLEDVDYGYGMTRLMNIEGIIIEDIMTGEKYMVTERRNIIYKITMVQNQNVPNWIKDVMNTL